MLKSGLNKDEVEAQITPLLPDENLYCAVLEEQSRRKLEEKLKENYEVAQNGKALSPEQIKDKIQSLSSEELRHASDPKYLKIVDQNYEYQFNLFKENKYKNKTITKEAVKLLLIDIGLLNP
ncbi:MAG: hypothetical protein HWD61_14040 [Parachlamydiaceae bacterium]|nr:MAG: hypothetical protein HWD61_14040 [Parachlamydiaceae bacterium]